MEFCGMRPDLLGPGRVMCRSVGDRFAVQHNYQTVEEGGLVRALVSLPTVRLIEADFLVRARDAEELYCTLEALTVFLLSGPGKLSTREMGDLYYLARCQEISQPVYRGCEAQVTATFLCEDYRVYRGTQPVGGIDPGTDNFTLGGRHCLRDMGGLFVMESRVIVPKQNAAFYTVPGRPGTLRVETGTLGTCRLTGTLYLVDGDRVMTVSRQQERLHALADWLLGRQELIFDAAPEESWMAELAGEVTVSRREWRNGRLSLSFDLQPYARRPLRSRMWEVDGEEADLDLSGLFPDLSVCTPVEMEVSSLSHAVAGLTVTHGAGVFQASCTLAPGERLQLDSEMGTCVRLLENGLSSTLLCSGIFPVLTPEEKVLHVRLPGAQAGTRITVSARERIL